MKVVSPLLVLKGVTIATVLFIAMETPLAWSWRAVWWRKFANNDACEFLIDVLQSTF
jgi:hypothetical protein